MEPMRRMLNGLFGGFSRLAKPYWSQSLNQTHFHFPVLMLLAVWLALSAQTAQAAALAQNGGFENGDFSGWTQTGDTSFSLVVTNDGMTTNFVHSGNWGAKLGPSSLGYLSQTVATTPGQLYLLSFWLDCWDDPEGVTPNEFTVAWNGTNLVDLVNFGPTGWVNYQYYVTATSTSTPITFGFQDFNSFLGFDDVTVTAVLPSFVGVARAGNNINLTWTSPTNQVCQVQYSTNLTSTNWLNLGGPITVTNLLMATTDTNAAQVSPRRFYRLRKVP